MHTLIGNTAAVSAAMGKGKGAVTGWAAVQGDFNTKVDIMRATVEVAAISIGTRLIPVLTSVLGWLTKNNLVIPLITGVLGLFAAAMVASATISIVSFAKMAAAGVAWAATQAGELIATAALWVMYTLGVESAG